MSFVFDSNGLIGTLSFTDKGTYNANTTYKEMDLVSYNGNKYRCIKDTTGNMPTNITYWAVFLDNAGYIESQKGVSNGVASLDAGGKVPVAQLPSYVDDVVEGYYYNSKFYTNVQHTTEIAGESGKIYVDIANETSYRWSGTVFTAIGKVTDISGKADKVSSATANNFASLDTNGNLKDSGKKVGDFATSGQGTKADNLNTEIHTARATYNDLNARLDAQENSIVALEYQGRTHKYGILWDRANAACTRQYDAVGLKAAAHKGSYSTSIVNDFDNLYPWSGRKLCNVDIAEYKRLYESASDIENSITAWEGDPDFSYDGTNGAVMVYTPEFWMHTEQTKDGVIVAVADKEIREWIKVPRYIGGRWFASDDGKGGVTSVGESIPLAHTSMSAIHNKAKTSKMTIDDIWTWTYDTVLMAVEFATLNSQTACGSGASYVYRYDGNSIDYPLIAETGANRVIAPVALANAAMPNAVLDIGTSANAAQVGRRIITSIETYANNAGYKIVNFSGASVDVLTTHCLSIHGICNTTDALIGSSSGYLGTDGKSTAYYRGRVAHANCFRYVLGAYREKDTGHIWIAHDRNESDNYDALDKAVHIDTGFSLPYQADGATQKEGYVQELYFHEKFPIFPFVKAVGGNSSNPVGDYCYHPHISTINTILVAGGAAYHGSGCGRLSGYWGAAAGYSSWSCAALPFLK